MDKQKKFLAITQKASIVDDKNFIVGNIIASDGSIDRHGESINPNGWNTDNYMKNPVVLYAHDYWGLPIGKIVKLWVEQKQLMCNIKFATTDFAKEVFQLFKDGILNAVSVGFIPLTWGVSGKDEYTIMEQELLELSVVPVPANPNALAKSLEGNEHKDEILEKVKKLYELADIEIKAKEAKEKVEKEKIEKEKAEIEAKEKEAKELAEKEAKEKELKTEKKEVIVIEKQALKEILKEAFGEIIKDYKVVEEKIIKEVDEKAKKQDEEQKQMVEALTAIRKFIVKSDSHIGNALRALKSITDFQLKGGEK